MTLIAHHPTTSSSKNHNPSKTNSVIFGFFTALFTLWTLSLEGRAGKVAKVSQQCLMRRGRSQHPLQVGAAAAKETNANDHFGGCFGGPKVHLGAIQPSAPEMSPKGSSTFP